MTADAISVLSETIIMKGLVDLLNSDPIDYHTFLDTPEHELDQYQRSTGRSMIIEFNLWENVDLLNARIVPELIALKCIKEIHRRGNLERRNLFLGK